MKKYICITLVTLVVFAITNKVEGKNNIDLSEYIWKNRLLLLFTPSPRELGYLQVNGNLPKQKEELRDRDLLVVHIVKRAKIISGSSRLSESSGHYLREKFSIKSGTFTVLLIGKDGGVKLRREGRVELAEVFSLIDSMPMRQREKRQKS